MVETICAEAKIADSTFYVHFMSKEAAVAPDEDGPAALVAATLQKHPVGEPLHATLRRAAHAVAERDLAAREALAARLGRIAREPALAAHAARGQARYAEELAGLLALQIGADASADVRPRLLVSAALGAR